MKQKHKTIEINGKACKVISVRREDYQVPVVEEIGLREEKHPVGYACTIRRHVMHVTTPDGRHKTVTIDPCLPNRPDDLDIVSVKSLPINPALQPKGLSIVRCIDGNRIQARMIIVETEPDEAPPMRTKKESNAAESKALAVLLRLSGIEGTPTDEDKLIKAFAKQSKGMEPGTSKADICRALARMELETARNNPDGCPWLNKKKAHTIANGQNFTKADIERHAGTLKRRLNRAAATPAPKTKRANRRK